MALCGNSVALSCVEASLQSRPGMRVLRAHQLGTDQPDVVVFELSTCQLDSLIAIWKAQPQILLIGLGLLEEGALVISGHASRVSTVEDLVEVIEGQSHGAAVRFREAATNQ